MPEYLSPGVYVEEVDTGNKPIEGVATSTVGFIGVAERGPVEATLVTSFSEYRRQFGGYVENRYLAYGAEGFFQNGGKRSFIARVFAPDAATATLAVGTLKIDAKGPGLWGTRVFVKVTSAGINDPNLFKLTAFYYDVLPANLQIDPTHPDSFKPANIANRREPVLIEVYDNLSANPLASSFYERLVNNASALVTLSTTGPPARPANNGAENTQPMTPIPRLANGTD